MVLVNNPDFFTTREILDASLDWLNKEDSLVESDIFGYNKYNEPLRFLYVAQYYSVSEDETEEKEETGVSHLVLQKYRANRWCDENDDGNLCPSRPSPRYTWGGKTRWEHLLAAAKERVDENDNKIDPPLIEIFREKYGHLSSTISRRYGADENKIVDDFKFYFLGIPDVTGLVGGNYFKDDKGYEDVKIMTEEEKREFNEEFKKKMGQTDSLIGEVKGVSNDDGGYSMITSPLDFEGTKMKIKPDGYFMRNVPLNAGASSDLYYNKAVGGYCGNVCFKEK